MQVQNTRTLLIVVLALAILAAPAAAQPPGTNYDEAKVGNSTLPDPLVAGDGEKVASADMWKEKRRPELLRLFETYVYGKVPAPPRPIHTTFTVRSEDRKALGGKAIRREIAIR